MNANNVIASRPKGKTLNISPNALLAIKKEIGEEMATAKKPSEGKKSSKTPAPKTNRKLVLQSSDSKAASHPHLIKTLRKSKTKTVSSHLVPKIIEAIPLTQVPIVSKTTEPEKQADPKAFTKNIVDSTAKDIIFQDPTIISIPVPLPSPFPKGVIIKDTIETTRSGLTSKLTKQIVSGKKLFLRKMMNIFMLFRRR